MKKLTVFYIQYSGTWGKLTNDATGDIESMEVPYHTSKLNVEYNLLLPGLKKKIKLIIKDLQKDDN